MKVNVSKQSCRPMASQDIGAKMNHCHNIFTAEFVTELEVKEFFSILSIHSIAVLMGSPAH